MKFFGKDIKEINKGYFGVRRCTICNEELRDVNLVELHTTTNICFVPVGSSVAKRLLVCQKCGSYMELSDDLWQYYQGYYNRRFNKVTTDNIISTLSKMNKQLENNGVKLNLEDKTSGQSFDLIYKSLVEKYKVWENIEEIISVFYK